MITQADTLAIVKAAADIANEELKDELRIETRAELKEFKRELEMHYEEVEKLKQQTHNHGEQNQEMKTIIKENAEKIKSVQEDVSKLKGQEAENYDIIKQGKCCFLLFIVASKTLVTNKQEQTSQY